MVTNSTYTYFLKYGFYNFIKIVNSINVYITNGRDVNQIDWDYCLANSNNLNPKDITSIINPIKNLKMEFWECCEYRRGRDNYFYTKCRLSMLPDNKYLNKLIINSIRKSYNIKTITNDFIEFSYNGSYAHSPYHKEKYIEDQDTHSLDEKFLLLVNLSKMYDPNEELLQNMALL